MAKASKGYTLKGSIRCHLKDFSGVRESFLPSIAINPQGRQENVGNYINPISQLRSRVFYL